MADKPPKNKSIAFNVADTPIERPPRLWNQPTGKAEQMADARARVMAMRVEGKTFAEIGATLGMAERTAQRHAARALKTAERESRNQAGQYRTLLTQRLERLHACYWPKAIDGNGEAADRIVRINERLARLNGLETITPSEGVGGGGVTFVLSRAEAPSPHPPIETTPIKPATTPQDGPSVPFAGLLPTTST